MLIFCGGCTWRSANLTIIENAPWDERDGRPKKVDGGPLPNMIVNLAVKPRTGVQRVADSLGWRNSKILPRSEQRKVSAQQQPRRYVWFKRRGKRIDFSPRGCSAASFANSVIECAALGTGGGNGVAPKWQEWRLVPAQDDPARGGSHVRYNADCDGATAAP